jgi:bifunctional enzyme CysN/CysC
MPPLQEADPYLTCDMLRFTTAGSVDDGKSTLIGRLLLDTKSIFEDQLEAVERASFERGEQYVDLALFTDGLRAEREQRITIDVAYRFFATPKRKFIIADTPGHIQYTRNMITGASTAELAIILIDAQRGVLTQSKRHGFLASLLHIPHILVAVNKMDLVRYSQAIYDDIVAEYTAFAAKLSVPDLSFIPISALAGDNVVHGSEHMPWYGGPSLLYHLEHVSAGSTRNLVDFRFPVQMALRPDHTFRGFMGQVASGTIHPGDEVMVLPGGQKTRVRSIVTFDGEFEEAAAGDVVTLTLEDEIDISRGNMIVRVRNVPQVSTALECTLCWMSEEPLNPQTNYILQHTTRQVRAHLKELTYRIDVDTLHREPAHTLALNEIGRVSLTTTQPIFFDTYGANRATGNFILIDPYTNNTVAAGMIRRSDTDLADVIVQEAQRPHSANVPPTTEFAEEIAEEAQRPRSTNVSWEHTTIGRDVREQRQGHKGAVLWFTGLSGSGKSTIAQQLERRLFALGCQVIYLDGDNVRHGLNGDLGFTPEDRKENIRRVAEVAKITFENGLLTLCAFISPSAAERRFARSLFPAGRFLEIYVQCDPFVAMRRDPKGLYAKAQRGEIQGFTGVHQPYEAPQHPELTLDTTTQTPDDHVDEIISYLKQQALI